MEALAHLHECRRKLEEESKAKVKADKIKVRSLRFLSSSLRCSSFLCPPPTTSQADPQFSSTRRRRRRRIWVHQVIWQDQLVDMIELARILTARLEAKVAPGAWHVSRELSDVFLDLVPAAPPPTRGG
jgi:hypothetical protein